jgi:hypothetical protein
MKNLDKIIFFNEISGELFSLRNYDAIKLKVFSSSIDKKEMRIVIDNLKEIEEYLLKGGRIRDFRKINFSRNLIKAYNGMLERFEEETIESLIKQLKGIFLVVNTLRRSKIIQAGKAG